MSGTRIGIISDTHMPADVKVLWDEVRVAFADVDLILHSGDIVHPKILDLAKQRKDRAFRAPSTVLCVSPRSKSGARAIETLYADRGENQSAASVALKSGDRLFVGSVYDDHILICDPSTLIQSSAATSEVPVA